jgi:hypothetical protein
MVIDDRPYSVGSTYRFNPNDEDGLTSILIDNEIWNLAGATVKLVLRKPRRGASYDDPGGGVAVIKTATIDDPALALAHYDSVAEDLDTVGWWTKAWKVQKADIVQQTLPIAFYVSEGAVDE